MYTAAYTQNIKLVRNSVQMENTREVTVSVLHQSGRQQFDDDSDHKKL